MSTENIQIGDHMILLGNVALQGSKTTADDVIKRFLSGENRTIELVTLPTPPQMNERSEMWENFIFAAHHIIKIIYKIAPPLHERMR